MNNNLFVGERVRLKAVSAAELAAAFSRWNRNSTYLRLLSSDPARQFSHKGSQEFIERVLQGDDDTLIHFGIFTLEDDRLIGDTDLDGIQWSQGESFVGMGIGQPEDWGKGYGTDAMRIILRYAFCELNLRRVTLNVFDYNPRAIRSYEKVGFVLEGRVRQEMKRAGQRHDILYMGILREEWEARTRLHQERP